MFKFTFILVLLFSTSNSNAQSKQELNGAIKKLLIDQKLSGAVWATISGDGKIVVDSYGYKNTSTKEPLTPTDKVHVGSVCKTILAAGFLRMATLGLLNLDDPIKKYLPNLPIQNYIYPNTPITIRHLLDHTSGLTDAKLWHIFSTTATSDTPLETVYFNSPNLLKIQTKPGSVYSYSNIGYALLGMVIEKITKERYEDYLDKNILEPLGMVNSSFQFISQTEDKKLAYGHFDTGVPVEAMPMYLRPAGQFTTTAEDMCKFLKFMMSDGKIENEPFIESNYLKAVGKQLRTDAYKNGVPFGDALGAYSRDRYGVVGIAKNGNTLGFTSMIYMFPEYRKAFFIAFNMDSETANYDLFNEILVKYLRLTTHTIIESEQKTESDLNNWDGYYVPILTKVEPFHLLDIIFSHTKVETLKTGAFLIPFQGKKRELIYQGSHLFSMRDRTNISHVFYKDNNGNLLITNGISTIKKIYGVKVLVLSTSLGLGVFGIVYIFISGFIFLIKNRFKSINYLLLGTFFSILTLLTSLIFILAQPIVSIGDKTIGSTLLAVSTATLPFISTTSLLLILKTQKGFINTVNFWATIFVIQFCALLIIYGLIPFTLWK